VLRRCVATGTSPGKTMSNLVWFRGSAEIENVHPVEGGFFRLKFRKDRRPGARVESPLVFYPKYAAETIGKQFRWASLFLRFYLILRRVIKDPRRLEYTDIAVAPPTEDEAESMEMFQSAEAHAYLVKIKKSEKLRHGAHV
ncbi:MAG TPA: hypothetical protein VM914_07810, partial [Pyrinomonadaceae bacterium]|nr:hypothetical protein [Pyrinomonadaceae bacterium]